MPPHPPQGLYTPVPTFFKQDFSLDLSTQVAHAKKLQEDGMQGLVIAGSMGEAPHLTREERVTLVKTIREAIPTKLTLIGGVYAQSVQDAIAEIQSLADAGADYAILLAPSYFGPNLVSQQGIVDWFTAVDTKAVLPFIVYHYPGVCNGVEINIKTYRALAKLDNVVGCKLTHFNMSLYSMLASDPYYAENNFLVFTGLGQTMIPSLSLGIRSAIDGLTNIFPKSMVEVIRLYDTGKLAEANKLLIKVVRVDEMISALNVVGLKFAIKQVMGFGDRTTGRPPLSVERSQAIWDSFLPDIEALWAVEMSL
ncbi:hypothetical protein BABINDRAFT_163801 [Babjeviella inositovora NRRL Y-12698]|uniref:Dihydrodipicolinate synthase n=1 Tax=Babjeviella inositovora NRRL Y-12698 TaxID=984486 RepID=A0A1E3QJA4_9ASCO|nr:uncharacterized protein BABINDRAFT_163801 [Babjeviella inositovora NRRL Y-12698]ODQ77067.1 hypothetical protein BABINDRAFT_163801 [Babjeviella inositovora NRRL Y-12698]